MQSKAVQWFMRYGLLVLAAITALLQTFCPPVHSYLRMVSLLCMVIAPFYGRTFLRNEDVRGWMLQNAALLAHAAVLIYNSLATGTNAV